MAKLTAEQQRWVERVAHKVKPLARAIGPRMPHASIEELESAGYEGLVQAALRYDPKSGVPFRTFAHYRMRGAMIDAARSAAPAIRRRSRAMKALQATQSLLEQAQQREPAAETGDTRTLKERVQAASELVARTTAAVVLSKLPPPNPETLKAKSADAEQAVIAKERKLALDRALSDCNEDERSMIDALYNDGLSMGEYAKQIGKNKSTVSRHHSRLMERLSKRMRRILGGAAPLLLTSE